MQVAEKHHTDRDRPRWLVHLAGPAILFLLCTGFFWKIVLTNQYTWLEGSPDLAHQVLPWFQFQAGEIHAGRIPLWDPYLWGGQSLIGQAQPGLAYPLNWILFLLPLRNGWIRMVYLHWYFVLIHFMAALFCYWLCRDLKRSRAASIIAGLAFGLGGYIGTTDWPQMLNGAVWAPLVFLFLLRATRGERPLANSALSGMFLGMAWLSGHHQIPIFITLAAGAVWLFFVLKSGRFELKMVRFGAIFVLFFLLTSGLQTVPAYEYGKLAKRWVGSSEAVGWKDPIPYNVHDFFSLRATSLLGIVIPGHHRHTDPSIGLVALSLALLGVALSWKSLPVRIFGAIAAGGLLFSLGRNNVFHGILYSIIPAAEKARNVSTAVFIFHFGIAVLVAYGIDSYLSSEHAPWQRRMWIALSVFGAVVFTILAVLVLAQKPPGDDRFVVNAFVALLFAMLLYGWRRGALSQTAACVLTAGLMLIELNNFCGYYWPNRDDKSRPKNLRYLEELTENADLAQLLRSQPWPVRFEVPTEEIPFNFGDWYGIDQYGGYLASLPVNFVRFDQFNARIVKMFGVNYSVTRKPPEPNQQEVFTAKSGLKLYWNTDAFPRAWAVHEAVQAHNDIEAIGFINDANIDLRKKVFLFSSPPQLETCNGDESVRMQKRTSGSLSVEADLKCRGMVLVGDSYFPGWRATVDGKPAKIFEANGMIRGVVVEAGRHTIEMKYRPRSVYLGALMTFAGFLGASALWFGPRIRRRSS